ncbi:MAG: methylated-DNA--[protein]-cysteine S-methyltransferase [Bacteroidota bacterium]
MNKKKFIKYIESPVGWLELKATRDSLTAISFVDEKGIASNSEPEILVNAAIQLDEYFKGERKEFDLNIAPEGTEFQKKVWQFVSEVSFGQTASYLDIAYRTGSQKNTRAVGFANGKNPLPIIIPCHRIIGSNGKLTGYAGGLKRKQWLLQHELKYSEKAGVLF